MLGMFLNNFAKKSILSLCILLLAPGWSARTQQAEHLSYLRVSENNRYLVKENGEPFFWLGDTGWFIFFRLDREEVDRYLEDRRAKGFNVIQTMLLRHVSEKNVYGDSALVNSDVANPLTAEGSLDYWDHVDYVIDKANEKGIYVALTLVWGSNVRDGLVTPEAAEEYARWLAERYRHRPGIIWMNGGDIKGNIGADVWERIGKTLKAVDPKHLVTFHPYGRDQSSTWFHNEAWLDFNMFQSGHERYDQDKTPKRYGEDNWRYVDEDFQKSPPKPTLDGEPSYEGIPHGLKDGTQPYWNGNDVRRYAYWSVFAGAFGFTYGHNAVFQFHKPGTKGRFHVRDFWYDAIDAPGAQYLIHLKRLMLSRPYLERIPAPDLLAVQGEKYDRIQATQGNDYAFLYTANGRNIGVRMGKISGKRVKAWWYDPRTGARTQIGAFRNTGTRTFDPPGETEIGNDWVLVLDNARKTFSGPGAR